MEKNYNYNFENRSLTKSAVHFGNVELASCKVSVLKKSPVSDGMLWHTTDTNEFYFDWDGKRTKLNVSGDNASLSAEIEKIKADIKKLDPDAVQQKVNQLEKKVNNAANQANNAKQAAETAKQAAQTAQQKAQTAANQAREAAAQVADKADKSYVDDAIAGINIPDVSNFALKSEIPDVSGFASKSDIPEIPENVSAFNNDAGYLTEHQSLEDYAKKSELDLYVKTDDLVDFVKESDLADYAKKDDLVDYLTSSDAAAFVKIDDVRDIVSEEMADKFVSQSDLDIYVKRDDLNDYITSSEFDARIADVVIPENVSAFNNDAGYITDADLTGYVKVEYLLNYVTSDDLSGYVKAEELENYVPKSELDDLASKSDLEGYVKKEDAVDYLTSSDIADYAKLADIPAEGAFPADSDVEDESAAVDGYATVQDVMDYVNTLLEKKKDLGDNEKYAYITAYPLNGTPTDITQFNTFLLNEEGDTEIEIMAGQEMAVWDPSTNEDLPSIKLTVDIPEDYTLSRVYIWSTLSNEYQLCEGSNAFGVNPRYASRDINGVTYNSYVRGPINELSTRGPQQYKIIVTK